ncbi:carboxymuconolactone decarboxylase family protein [Kitasatospora sp. NPDC092948]|uniref:carboxymuconolactone decarboxylase family protein n=1 Tax=Kitasatospora sp. NPDC092948 TaxID=3364088 RepID=UPI0037F45A09
MTAPQPPRIAPLEPARIRDLVARQFPDAEQLLTAAGLDGRPILNVLATLAADPTLLAALFPLLDRLGRGTLPDRDRETVVLRVAWRTRSAYEWAHHARFADELGLTGEDRARIAEGPDADGHTDRTRTLLRAVDELHRDAALGDDTWRALGDSWTEPQILELLTLVGLYTLVAYVLNSCRVPLDSWLPDPEPLP